MFKQTLFASFAVVAIFGMSGCLEFINLTRTFVSIPGSGGVRAEFTLVSGNVQAIPTVDPGPNPDYSVVELFTYTDGDCTQLRPDIPLLQGANADVDGSFEIVISGGFDNGDYYLRGISNTGTVVTACVQIPSI